ncbi:MAG: hypothetical protein ABEH86_03010 [Haloarcula sp.]
MSTGYAYGSHRHLRNAVSSAALGGLAGCTAPDVLGDNDDRREYTLTVETAVNGQLWYGESLYR